MDCLFTSSVSLTAFHLTPHCLKQVNEAMVFFRVTLFLSLRRLSGHGIIVKHSNLFLFIGQRHIKTHHLLCHITNDILRQCAWKEVIFLLLFQFWKETFLIFSLDSEKVKELKPFLTSGHRSSR